MEILEQSALILAIVGFGRGLTTLARDPRNKLFLSYFALQLAVTLWALSFFMAGVYGLHFYERLHLLFNVALAPTGLWFLKFLTRKKDAFGRKLFRGTVVLSAV